MSVSVGVDISAVPVTPLICKLPVIVMLVDALKLVKESVTATLLGTTNVVNPPVGVMPELMVRVPPVAAPEELTVSG